MTRLYFAYGSNMSRARMRERVPGAESLGPSRLPGHGLRVDKRGVDGSAKANLVAEPAEHVWGVLYRIPHAGAPTLDAFERGYQRLDVVVEADGASHGAFAYRSHRRIEALPFDWYVELMLTGAREHGLPRGWIERLVALRRQPTVAARTSWPA